MKEARPIFAVAIRVLRLFLHQFRIHVAAIHDGMEHLPVEFGQSLYRALAQLVGRITIGVRDVQQFMQQAGAIEGSDSKS